MEKIGFLTWNRLDDIESKSTRGKLKNFYKYTIQTIEKDINRNGGIAGKNIFIDFLDVPVDYDEAKKIYEDKINNSPSILFAKGPSVFTRIGEKKVEYIKTVESATRLLFHGTDISKSKNIKLLANNIGIATGFKKLNHSPSDPLERAKKYCPPLTIEQPRPLLSYHLCDIFTRRNFNRPQKEEIDNWTVIRISAGIVD